ncbi:MAG: hypothetical protein ACR2P4_03770 [Gammaproteobacteria bacterium]
MPPLQGFYNVAAIAAIVQEIPAFAGMTKGAGMTELRGNDKTMRE